MKLSGKSAFKKLFTGCAAAAFLSVSGMVATAAEDPPKDEKALAILQSMSDYMKNAKTLSLSANTFFDHVRKSGIKIKVGRKVDVQMKRPNHFVAEAVSDDGQAHTMWFDGAKLTVWSRHANEVSTLEFKGTTDQVMDHVSEKHGVVMPIADMLYNDIAGGLKDTIMSSEYIGLRTVNGVDCHHLSFESTGADWQIWIRADSTPLPCRFAINFVTLDDEPQFFAQFNSWSIGGEPIDAMFSAAVPEGTKKVEFGSGLKSKPASE